jgi:hypothetical protein
MTSTAQALVAVIASAISLSGVAAADLPRPDWKHLSSKTWDLPVPPGGSTPQTGAVVGDFDGDGGNDFILSFSPAASRLAR